jgi:hypothetical protein
LPFAPPAASPFISYIKVKYNKTISDNAAGLFTAAGWLVGIHATTPKEEDEKKKPPFTLFA